MDFSKEENLVLVPEDERDESWEENFLNKLPHLSGILLQDTAFPGPDSFPYMGFKIDPPSLAGFSNKKGISNSKGNGGQKVLPEDPDPNLIPCRDLLNWLKERGIGLAVNPHKSYPDCVLNYGMIWYFAETGSFLFRPPNASNSSSRQSAGAAEQSQRLGSSIWMTEPARVLPSYVLKVVRQFLGDQGILHAQAAIMTWSAGNSAPTHSGPSEYESAGIGGAELIFQRESLGRPAEEELVGICEALSWFLPRHFSVAISRPTDPPPHLTDNGGELRFWPL